LKEKVTELEMQVAKLFADIEASSDEFKRLLTNLFIQKVVIKELQLKGERAGECILIYIPYPCLKVMRAAH